MSGAIAVTDGSGATLATAPGSDLFGAGLELVAPIPSYDPTSGANIAVITFAVVRFHPTG